MSDFEYQGIRRIVADGAYFIPVCKNCGRFTKPYDQIIFDGDGQPVGTNATCKKCGEVEMIFEGYY